MVRAALASLVALTLVGCGELEIPITRTKTFVVESAGATCASVIHEESLDTDEARPYLDKLTAVEIREVSLSITHTNTTGDSVATSMTGSLSVAAPGSDAFTTLLDPTTAPIALGAVEPLPTVNAQGAQLAGSLVMTPPHGLQLKAEGCFDQTPAGVEFEATITYVLRGSLF